jgi:hypothetical protein
MLKVWHKSKMFLHVQNTQTSKMDSAYFFQTFFSLTKSATFFLKTKKDFNIND